MKEPGKVLRHCPIHPANVASVGILQYPFQASQQGESVKLTRPPCSKQLARRLSSPFSFRLHQVGPNTRCWLRRARLTTTLVIAPARLASQLLQIEKTSSNEAPSTKARQASYPAPTCPVSLSVCPSLVTARYSAARTSQVCSLPALAAFRASPSTQHARTLALHSARHCC